MHRINRIMLLRLQTPILSADVVSAGDFFFLLCLPTEQSYSCSVSDAGEEHDRRVQSVCESTFNKV